MSCDRNENLTNFQMENTSKIADILSFNSIDELEHAINMGHNYDSNFNKLKDGSSKNGVFGFRSNSTNETIQISFEDLIPERNLAQLFNNDGEIIIADTVYKVNVNGTYFAHKRYLDELRKVSMGFDNKEIRVDGDLYKIGNIYRFDTYKNAEFNDYFESDNSSYRNDLRSRSVPDINSLEEVPGFKHTIIGKFFQGIGVRKSNTILFPSDNTKRLNCAIFEYNNIFRQSVGITAKIQKKDGLPN